MSIFCTIPQYSFLANSIVLPQLNGVRLFPFLSFLKFYFEIFKRLKGALNLPNLILLLFFSFINVSYSLSHFFVIFA